MCSPSPSLQAILAKKWFGFDLDDTLHDFRKASAQASLGVFNAIHTKYGIDIDSLKVTYEEILRISTANAFTDGRTSTDYRRERFTQLLQTLQRLGKKVIVITEGPADAQEWTVGELGLSPYIDIVVTTNKIGKSKVDGLFGVVLEKYGIAADEIVYYGDNEVRDIKAAQGVGILAVLYDENRESLLEDLEELRIDSWETLQHNMGPN